MQSCFISCKCTRKAGKVFKVCLKDLSSHCGEPTGKGQDGMVLLGSAEDPIQEMVGVWRWRDMDRFGNWNG